MKYDLKDIPDGRGAKLKYPWHLLKSEGDFFEWDNIEDRNRIRATASYHNIRVACRKVDGKLHVIRLEDLNVEKE